MKNPPNLLSHEDHQALQTLILILIFGILSRIVLGQTQSKEPPVQIQAQVSIEVPEKIQAPEDRVLEAMRIMAAHGKVKNLDALMQSYQADPQKIAVQILQGAKQHQLDPLLLVVIAWNESRFNPKAMSDFVKRPAEGQNCGLLQVRTDLPGRPSCDQMKSSEKNIGWVADHLQGIASLCRGELCLVKYNAGNYETRVWRKLDWLRRQLWLKESR